MPPIPPARAARRAPATAWIAALLVVVALLGLVALPGCAAPAYLAAETRPAPGFSVDAANDAGALFADGESNGSSDGPALADRRAPRDAAGSATPTARKLVHEARLAVRVPRVDDAVAWLTERVTALGGYVSQRIDGRVTARIPVDTFDTLLAEVRARGVLEGERIVALDVTEQHRDLTIRLANARRSHARLLELLDAATEVEDVLAIEKELQRLTTEIERLTAELENLDQRIALSLLEVDFRPADAAAPVDHVERPSRFLWIRSIGAEHVLRWF